MQCCRFTIDDILVCTDCRNKAIHFTKTVIITRFSILTKKQILFLKHFHYSQCDWVHNKHNLPVLPSTRSKDASCVEKTFLCQEIRLPYLVFNLLNVAHAVTKSIRHKITMMACSDNNEQRNIQTTLNIWFLLHFLSHLLWTRNAIKFRLSTRIWRDL